MFTTKGGTMFKKFLLTVLVLSFTTTAGLAVESGGAIIPDTMSIDNEELVLNGTGIRKKFGFKVYVGGLYLRAKTMVSQDIINGDEPMAITMTWRRSGPIDKVTDVFADGFKYAAAPNYDGLKPYIDKFLGSVVKAEKQDVWKYLYTPGKGTAVYYNDVLSTTIDGLEFKKALFAVWLLETDVFTGDKELRDGMLGK